jgi:mevalonate kinase
LKSIASAPGKIILFGEHFVVHGTKAILAAIDKRVTVTSTITPGKKSGPLMMKSDATLKINSQLGTFEIPMYEWERPDDSLEGMCSLHGTGPSVYLRDGEVPSELRPFVYLAAKLSDLTRSRHYRKELALHPDGLEITIDSDIPVGVGLGSSSACCVAAAASLYALFQANLGGEIIHDNYSRKWFGENETEDILLLAKKAEETIFPDTSGADCTVCTYGGMIEYSRESPYHDTSIEKIDNTFDLNLLIANSMIPHNTKNSVEKVNKFKENDEERFSQLCDLENGLIDEVIVAMKNNDAAAFGLKMSENQKYLEEIQVSNDTLRDMMSSLKEISLGTKITGAGDGGCIIALGKDENVSKMPALLGKDKECFSAKIDTKGVVWSKIEE